MSLTENDLNNSHSKMEREFLQAIDIIPGLELKNSLEEIFPLSGDSKDADTLHFLDEMDECLNLNGELTKLVHESLVRYLVRRLINTADFFKRKFST
jgi:hypothetical protein